MATISGRHTPEHLRAFFDTRGDFAHPKACEGPRLVATDGNKGLAMASEHGATNTD